MPKCPKCHSENYQVIDSHILSRSLKFIGGLAVAILTQGRGGFANKAANTMANNAAQQSAYDEYWVKCKCNNCGHEWKRF